MQTMKISHYQRVNSRMKISSQKMEKKKPSSHLHLNKAVGIEQTKKLLKLIQRLLCNNLHQFKLEVTLLINSQ